MGRDDLPTTGIVTKAEFARLCGVSRAAVGKAVNLAIERGEAPADLSRIDVSAPWAQEYMVASNASRRTAALKREQPAESSVPTMGDRPSLELRKLAGEVRKLELDNGKKERSLVARVLVERFVGVVDRALNMIIMDGRATLIPQLYQKIKGGCSLEEAQLFYHDKCGKYIAPAKPEMLRALKKYDKEN